ncbi:hypothetical protein L1887_56642 [Cichorium endivia]|nr:hypothetical protein L1887_56642 [Cichorium endivia]
MVSKSNRKRTEKGAKQATIAECGDGKNSAWLGRCEPVTRVDWFDGTPCTGSCCPPSPMTDAQATGAVSETVGCELIAMEHNLVYTGSDASWCLADVGDYGVCVCVGCAASLIQDREQTRIAMSSSRRAVGSAGCVRSSLGLHTGALRACLPNDPSLGLPCVPLQVCCRSALTWARHDNWRRRPNLELAVGLDFEKEARSWLLEAVAVAVSVDRGSAIERLDGESGCRQACSPSHFPSCLQESSPPPSSSRSITFRYVPGSIEWPLGGIRSTGKVVISTSVQGDWNRAGIVVMILGSNCNDTTWRRSMEDLGG